MNIFYQEENFISIKKGEIMNKPDCYKCNHRGRIAGDAHSCCEYPGTKTGMFDTFSIINISIMKKLNIKGDPAGIKKGWFAWPVNFDPTWLRNCDGFGAKEEKP